MLFSYSKAPAPTTEVYSFIDDEGDLWFRDRFNDVVCISQGGFVHNLELGDFNDALKTATRVFSQGDQITITLD